VRVTDHGKRAGKWFYNQVRSGGKPTDRERVSPSASKPGSASLHQVDATKRPDSVKSAICREATGKCTCRASRGDRGERARKDAQRNLGDPLWPGVGAGG